MKSQKIVNLYSSLTRITLGWFLALLFCSYSFAQVPANAAKAYNTYITGVEVRLNQQHRNARSFVAAVDVGSENQSRLHNGELIVEELTPATNSEFAGAMLHHWRSTAFVAGARAADFERLLKDFNSYPKYFSPQVLQAKVLTAHGDQMQAAMRVRQKHVITVVLDSTYDVNFGRLDAQHGYSSSVSTRVAEIEQAGTHDEHALSVKDEHGFLWRQNTYWSYEERDGGLYMQVESVSLSRSIPTGLGWAIKPFVESVPRESLEFTLKSAANALKK